MNGTVQNSNELLCGDLVVIKAGGYAITNQEARYSIMNNILELTDKGIKVLLVYGGGHLIDHGLVSAGIKPRKINGRRITGSREIEVVKQVMVADLSFRVSTTMAELDIKGFCLNAIPASWIDIAFRERENADDYGYDGTIPRVFGEQILNAFSSTIFIATPCQGISHKNAVNINADNAAVALAIGTQAKKLFFLSNVDGVLKDGQLIPAISDQEIPVLIEKGDVIDGMRVKLENCLYALKHGVHSIHLLNGLRPDALLQEISNGNKQSTVLFSSEKKHNIPFEEVAENTCLRLS